MSRMNRQYHFLKNWGYALAGIREVVAQEMAFRLELIAFAVFAVIVPFLPVPVLHKVLLFASLFIPLVVEMLNSAVERVVDLVTLDHHELAKTAKDAGSGAVFLSILATGSLWVGILYVDCIQGAL